jgi:hypothetical protein
MNILVDIMTILISLLGIFVFASIIPYALVQSFTYDSDPVIWNPIKVWSEFFKICLKKQDE